MSEVAKAVKPLFDKFIDFFDIFDLSFFVSGATFVAAIAWAGLTPDLARLIGFAPIEDGTWFAGGSMPSVSAAMLVLASYVSGMTCFALGRFVRKWVFRVVDKLTRNRHEHRVSLLVELAQHGMVELCEDGTSYRITPHGRRIPWLSRYLINGGHDQEPALYVRMWAEVRQRELFAPSFSLLRRYWVSSATLDGLFVAFCTWAVLLALVQQAEHGWIPSLATFGGALFCLREARRYGEYQREELVATLMLGYDMPDMDRSDATAPTAAPANAVSEAVDAGSEIPAGGDG
ncbi:MAG TPA: hypothetical protein VK034_03165 [Enhygromyxa sp.]|nr:hypothetical protein [Enhygromyxa sp.]